MSEKRDLLWALACTANIYRYGTSPAMHAVIDVVDGNEERLAAGEGLLERLSDPTTAQLFTDIAGVRRYKASRGHTSGSRPLAGEVTRNVQKYVGMIPTAREAVRILSEHGITIESSDSHSQREGAIFTEQYLLDQERYESNGSVVSAQEALFSAISGGGYSLPIRVKEGVSRCYTGAGYRTDFERLPRGAELRKALSQDGIASLKELLIS